MEPSGAINPQLVQEQRTQRTAAGMGNSAGKRRRSEGGVEETLVNLAEAEDVAREDLKSPLLASSSAGSTPHAAKDWENEGFFGREKPKFWVGPQVINLGNTIVGAGLMALPKVVEKLGIVMGCLSLLLVLLCTVKTLNYMLVESTRVGSTSFASVVKQRLGPRASLVTEVSIVINNIGLLIIYLRIISDVLIGNADYTGIITNFVKDGLITKPEFTVGLIAFCVLLPLCGLEKMNSLAAASTSGLSLALCFSAITIALSCVEIHRNGLAGVSWGPNPKYFGADAVSDLLQVIGVFPVIFTSLVCHYNLLHVKEDLPPTHYNKMPKIVRLAGGGCVALYVMVASFGYVLFKDDVQGDVLLNFSCKSLEDLVGSRGCVVVAVLVRSLYAITLSMTFPLIHFALRQTEMGLLFARDRRTPLARWGVSLANLLVAYVLALKVPNIWTPLQITGAVAAGIIGFIIPSLLHLRVPEGPEKTTGGAVVAVLLLSLGVIVGAVTVYQLFTGGLG